MYICMGVLYENEKCVQWFGLYLFAYMAHSLASVDLPDSKVHGANMGLTLGWQDPGGPYVCHVNLAIWELSWLSG